MKLAISVEWEAVVNFGHYKGICEAYKSPCIAVVFLACQPFYDVETLGDLDCQ